ncbi:hypothetical protein RH915_04780 [Serpentinicella sp. ANB-PHB4]|nr:hypothetical protein [Serpentinicella sp. ANB-PHB4]MDR5658799.1 hypothetical protein [Serpentinicella sp. ANB-PHB4]
MEGWKVGKWKGRDKVKSGILPFVQYDSWKVGKSLTIVERLLNRS